MTRLRASLCETLDRDAVCVVATATRRVRKGVAALGLALALISAGCRQTAPEGHATRGVVQRVDLEHREILVDHEEIPGVMHEMTMLFGVAADVELEALAAGDVIEFRVRDDDGLFTVTEIRPSLP